ncbi:MAG: hypothetical protein HDR88_10345 [Bacteroides sp.]|nr:hypothetical protein [Bacteroides sp.]
MKTKFDIEINNNDKISGGYIMTTEPMTLKQVAKVAEKMGRELLANNKSIDRVSYTCWESEYDDVEKAAVVSVILSRHGRKILVTTY